MSDAGDRARRAVSGPNGFPDVPPSDLEAERCYLGSLLLLEPKEFLEAVASIEPEHLYATDHRRIFSVFRKLGEERLAPDPGLLRQRAPEFESDLAKLARHVPTPHNWPEYAEAIRHAARARTWREHLLEFLYRNRDPKEWRRASDNLTEVLAKIDARLVAPEKPRLPAAHDLKHVLATEPEPVPWIIDELIERGTTSLWFGATYTGKSTIAWWLALAVARGDGEVLGRDVVGPAKKVLLVLGENPVRDARRTLGAQLQDQHPPDDFLILDAIGERLKGLADPEGRKTIEAILDAKKPDVVVLDNLMSLARADMSDSEVATDTMLWLKELSRTRGTTFLVIHHTRKAGSKGDDGSHMDRLYGAQEWGSFAESAYYLAFEENQGAQSPVRILHHCKCRNAGVLRPALILEINEDTLVPEVKGSYKPAGAGDGFRKKADPELALKALADANKPLTREELADTLGVTDRSIRNLFKDPLWQHWIQNGRVEVVERNRKGQPSSLVARLYAPSTGEQIVSEILS